MQRRVSSVVMHECTLQLDGLCLLRDQISTSFYILQVTEYATIAYFYGASIESNSTFFPGLYLFFG
jgi:hypothetical protein